MTADETLPLRVPDHDEVLHDLPQRVLARSRRHRSGVRRSRGDQDVLAKGQGRVGRLARYRAERKVVPASAGIMLSYAAFALWAIRHIRLDFGVSNGALPSAWPYSIVFLLLAWQMTACFLEQPYRRRRGATEDLHTVVLVPVYNEDPALLADCLESLLSQSRRPDRIVVVDDGSETDLTPVQQRFETAARFADVQATWIRYSPNRGKRHAQAEAIRCTPEADIYITVDSDAILDYEAITEAMKPFADPDVASVAGVLLLANNRKNLITRTSELWYVTSELVDRSALSAMRCVLVNTGTFALYRAAVVRKHLTAYENERFFGRPVQFSDDSMLTFYALLEGKTVQQPTALGFTAMPENLSHHVRQYLRWMRGMTIRTFWRFRYLPLGSYIYWNHLMRWVQAAITLPLFVTAFAIDPVRTHRFSVSLLIVPLLVCYGRSLRYLTIRRYDEPAWSQLLTYLTAPLVAMWTYTALRFLWWYAMATCLKTGWGTRQHVEVIVEEP
jgi:hyaluronan synthase